jgi:hypothetical protein
MKESPTVCMFRSTAVDPDPRVERVACLLSEQGMAVRVLAWDRERCSPRRSRASGVAVRRVRWPGRYGAGIGNLPGLIGFNASIIGELLAHKPAVVYCCDLDTALAGFLFRRLSPRTVFVYDVFDTFAHSRKVGRLGGGLLRLERALARQADVLVVPDRNRLRPLLCEGIGHAVVLPNTPLDMLSAFRGQERFDGAVYVGVLHRDRGLSMLVDAAEQAGINLRVAGFGPEASTLRQRLGADFLGRLDHLEALRVQHSARAIVALYDPSVPNNRMAAPNKLYEAMMVGRPLISTKQTPIGDFVEENGIGLAVEYGDRRALTEALKRIVRNPGIAEEMGTRARALYETKYSWEKCSVTLLKSVNSTLRRAAACRS